MSQGVSNWEAVKSLVADALELSPDARQAFINDRCNGDDTLAEEVAALITAYDDAEGVIDSGADAWLGLSGRDTVSLAGHKIGRYQLERLLAEGANGAVYVAQQISPNRRVAIKLLRTVLPLVDAAHRFKRESAALGRLQHPNIARIYESGVHRGENATNATPFLAMELVDGLPLNKYAREKKLSREERVKLIIKVAQAVHAAHQQAVIHRDLKPANVLVDANGEPKVLDFGLARIAELDDDQNTWQTTAGVMLGTPGYMSPEQASGNQDSVDVRSDVWSLGVLLYELLADQLPLDVKGKSFAEIVQTLEQSEPKPLGQVDPTLRGDLETIVGTALAKDKSERYASAEAFADDLRNVLEYEPIKARAPSRWYRAKKFVRRNRLAVALITALAITLIGATVISTSSLVRERRQRDRAEAVNTFLNDVISRANPNTGGKDLTMRDVMSQAEGNVATSFASQPEVEAELRRTIGWAYYNISDFPAAQRNLAKSIELFNSTVGQNNPQTLKAMSHMVSVLRMLSKYDEALSMVETAINSANQTLGNKDELTLQLEIDRAALLTDMSKMDRAAAVYKELIPRLKQSLGENNEQTLLAENNYGYMLMSGAKYAEAEPVLEEVVRRGGAMRGPDHPELFPTRSNVLTVKTNLGKLEECEPLYRTLSADVKRILGENHRRSQAVDSEFSQLLSLIGKYDESIELMKSVIERSRVTNGPEELTTFKWEMFLTHRYLNASRFVEAEAAAREILPRARRVLGEEFLTTLLLEDNLARALNGQKKFVEAEPIFRASIPKTLKIAGEKNNWYANARLNFARCLNGLGKYEEALENIAIARQICDEMNLVNTSPNVRRELAQTYALMNKFDEAEKTLLEAVEKDKALSNPRQLQRTTAALAELYDKLNKPEDAARVRASTQPATAPAK